MSDEVKTVTRMNKDYFMVECTHVPSGRKHVCHYEHEDLRKASYKQTVAEAVQAAREVWKIRGQLSGLTIALQIIREP